ncbi:hypothetical protein DL770_007865 [Monosporascus sp. CRB-9-2]|nr:hypothetical protein DL770_007865 [Monosporascus sp. CRB-9-2]
MVINYYKGADPFLAWDTKSTAVISCVTLTRSGLVVVSSSLSPRRLHTYNSPPIYLEIVLFSFSPNKTSKEDSTSNNTSAGQDDQNQDLPPWPSSPGPHVDTQAVPACPEEQPRGPLEYRTLYLLSYVPSPLLPAHWSMWVPCRGSDGSASRRGQLPARDGRLAERLRARFDWDYDPDEGSRRPWVGAAARIEERHVDGTPMPEGVSAYEAHNRLERVAPSISRPGARYEGGFEQCKAGDRAFVARACRLPH